MTTPLILPYKDKFPQVAESAYIAPSANIVGEVEIGEFASIWFQAVVRADVNYIKIGARSNLQDGAIVHESSKYPTIIGENVTVGHGAIIHAATVGDNCLIGMASCLMDGVIVESGCMIAAGALVTPGKHVPAGELWAGSPAKFVRKVTPEEAEFILKSAEKYVVRGGEYS